jgi:uncharacterized protein GlcG (DUF336 family)
MSAYGKFLGATALSLAFTVAANAQAPQTVKNVSMKMALMIIDGALEQCSKDGYKVSVVLVDKGGNVAASVRGDGTNPHTMEFARLKAYTSRTQGQTSLEVQKRMEKPENAWLKQIPNVIGAVACRSKLALKPLVAWASPVRPAARRMKLAPMRASPKWSTA